MSATLAPKLAAARAAGTLARLAGSGATSMPGKLLLRLEPRALARFSGQLQDGCVMISATNGKTTSAALLSAILEDHGLRVLSNRSGANMAGGIASSFLQDADAGGQLDRDIGVLEVDEMWLSRLIEPLGPRVIVLGNLLRDQLDRYGELEAIAASWAQALQSTAGLAARPVLCADDPLVAGLAGERDDVLFFGVEDRRQALPALGHAADARHCRNCGGAYHFDAVFLAHLGHYRCPACGEHRPQPEIRASEIRLEGLAGSSFQLQTPAGDVRLTLPLPGLYNLYNALAACAAAHALGIPPSTMADAISAIKPAFGRAERLRHNGAELSILLIKNPVGATEVLRTLAATDGQLDLLIALNDQIADGRDISWIWDADFELLAGRLRQVTCTGSRAAEVALRLKYAGFAGDCVHLEDSMPLALRSAAQAATTEGDGQLHVLPTYTAMLQLRKLLGRGGRRLGSGR